MIVLRKAVMRTRAILLIAWLSCLAFDPVYANGVRPDPLDRQLARADLVVVGRLGARTTCTMRFVRQVCAEILTETLIKGPVTARGVHRYLILSSNVMEFSIEDIFIPESALLFMDSVQVQPAVLLDTTGEFYLPLQGHRSVVPLNFFNATEVQREMCPLRHMVARLRSAAEISPC